MPRPAPSSPPPDHLDAVFHALSDRTRRALLARLAAGPAMITDLAKPFPMSFVAVSKHVRVLERARLVERTVTGRVHRCRLDAGPLAAAEHWLDEYRPFWESTLDALADYVESGGDRKRLPRRRG
jgi:DNA-binding transcriptional ArsR family regulator